MPEFANQQTQGTDPQVRDPLTGAYARGLLREQLERQIERARQHAASFSLCMFDLDYFKSVNDTYGHTRGDQVLRDLVQRLQTLIRGTDMLFRYGGDEFVLLLPDTPKAQAMQLAQRLLDGVYGAAFAGQPPLWLSLSIGVADFPNDTADPDVLFELADRRSYAAKRLGGARIVGEDLAPQGSLPTPEFARLVEREAALDTLQRFLIQLPSHRRGALSVRGAAGVGHTRFLAEAARAARLRGYATLIVHATLELHSWRYGALMAAAWPSAKPELISAAQIGAALQRAIATQDQVGLLVIVDEMPALDRASLELLRQLIEEAPIACLGLVYSASANRLPVLAHRALPLNELIELQPLSSEGLRAWLRGLLHWEPPAPFLAWLHQQTGGLPAALQRGLAFLFEHNILRQTAAQGWLLDASYPTIPLDQRLGLRATPPPNNLPPLRTKFVGREAELAQLMVFLDTQRLVTLLGPGGIGKTRLALQLASVLLDEHSLSGSASFADGIYFVPLAALSDPALVAGAITQALGASEIGDTSIEQLQNHLNNKHLLLILDNFEQVIDAAPLVGELLAAPQLRILVTSRSALQISGEQQFIVPPLALPNMHDFAPVGAGLVSPPLVSADRLADLAQYAGVTLFIQRAHAVKPDFALTSSNARSIAEICTRLEGLPLAIELAAARSNVLPPSMLLARLAGMNRDSPLRLLTGGPRDLPARQQTLRGAIEWSYQLLDQDTRRFFARLAVFVDGCTLEAAEIVCGGEAIKVAGWDSSALTPIPHPVFPILDGLASLVNQSLLQQAAEASAVPRFVMLETIREYALERLAEHGETDLMRRRHAAYFLALAEEAEPQLQGAGQRLWLERLDPENDNLRGALQWVLDQGEGELAGRLSAALWRFWSVRSQLGEGRHWLEAALALQLPPSVRVTALYRAGILALFHGDQLRAITLCEKCEALARTVGDQPAQAYALLTLGGVAMQQGDYARVRSLLTESLLLFRAIQHVAGITWALDWMGDLARIEGHDQQAAACYHESLALRRPAGDLEGIGWSCHHLGDLAGIVGEDAQALAFYQESRAMFQAMGHQEGTARALERIGQVELLRGNLTEAQIVCEQSLALSQSIGFTKASAHTLHWLANVACEQTDFSRARALHLQGLALATTLKSPEHSIYSLRGIARLAAALDQPLRAARLFGAAEALQHATSKWGFPFEHRYYMPLIGAARSLAGPDAWAAAWAAGQALTLEQAIAEARSTAE
jgi:diguanylate cyclase (GGDEF)-like protein